LTIQCGQSAGDNIDACHRKSLARGGKHGSCHDT
jgi:hypothetical protein